MGRKKTKEVWKLNGYFEVPIQELQVRGVCMNCEKQKEYCYKAFQHIGNNGPQEVFTICVDCWIEYTQINKRE